VSETERVSIVEVGPRDGLQNEPTPVATAAKRVLIEALVDAGLGRIEVTAFVSPRRVPQMADHAELLGSLPRRKASRYAVLVPNLQGCLSAIESGAREISIFTASSETFCKRNINCSIAESLRRFEPVMATAASHGIAVRGYLSCVMGCPWEGDVAPQRVAALAWELRQLGCHEISLGDTIGVGTPGQLQPLIEAVAARVPMERLAGHFHDTYGQALVNVHAALQLGLRCFDSSVAGLGGCPFAPGAAGNLATEELVYLLHGLGYETGVDLQRLTAAGVAICQVLGHPPRSRVAAALTAAAGRESSEHH